MYKIAAIIGGVLLMAGVALGGPVTSLGSTDSPTLSKLPLAASTTATTATTTGRDDRGREAEQRGRANEPGEDVRGRENEPNEDLRGPCDEAEHANDPRCTGVVSTGTVTTRVDDERRTAAILARAAASPVTAATTTDPHPGRARRPGPPPGRLVVTIPT
jgi:hypothetical protein